MFRYIDRYVTVTQGEVFYATEALSQLEGLERGPVGNTSLAAAIDIAKEMDKEQIIVVQETEYTGAGKHPIPQLNFARQNGIEVRRGDPKDNIPGKNIIIPERLDQINIVDIDLIKLKEKYLEHSVKKYNIKDIEKLDFDFLVEDTNSNEVGDAVDIMAVIKGDAYGHGILEISSVVLENGATKLGIAVGR